MTKYEIPVRDLIGFDYDGTLVRAADGEFFDWLAAEGHRVNKQLYYDGATWEEATGCTGKELGILYGAFSASVAYPEPEPLAGAPTALEIVSQTRRVQIITSRGVGSKKKIFNELCWFYHRVRIESVTFDSLNRKGTLVAERSVKVYLEDNLRHAQEVVEHAPVILIPQQCNRWVNDPRLIVTQAHAEIDDEMSDADWKKVWAAAWEEIPHLIHDLITSPLHWRKSA